MALTPAVTPHRADRLLPEVVAAAGVGADHRLVLGGGLADHVAAAEATVAPAGLPGTGTWATVASQLDTLAAAGTRAGHDRRLRPRLSIMAQSTIDLSD